MYLSPILTLTLQTKLNQQEILTLSFIMGYCQSIPITSSQYINAKLTKPIIHFEAVQDQCTLLGTGFFSNAYLYPKESLVLKIIRKPYLQPLLNQIKLLDHLKPIWPDLCRFQVVSNGKLVGFSIKYFAGHKINEILQAPDNIYHQSPQSRIRLVKKLKSIIQKIQALSICHGDIYLDNIMINQPDKTRQDCEIMIIDFGNGFIFDENTRTNSGLMGWKFMVPPEARTGKKYDPKGVNAFMYGRVALQVLLLTPLDDYQKGKIKNDPSEELKKLKVFGFDQSVIEHISKCLSDDLDTRIKALKSEQKMSESVRKGKN